LGAAPTHGLISGQAGRTCCPCRGRHPTRRPQPPPPTNPAVHACSGSSGTVGMLHAGRVVDQPTSLLTRARTLRADAGPLVTVERAMRGAQRLGSWIVQHACGCGDVDFKSSNDVLWC